MARPEDEPDDAVWVARAREGDAAAFGRLVSRYRRLVLTVAWQMTGNGSEAEDVAQESFLRAFRHVARFRGEASFKTWLLRIVANVAFNWRRAAPRSRAQALDAAAWEALPASADGPERSLLDGERLRTVQEAVLALPEHYRSVVVLREWQGLSYREIGEALDIPLGTVMSRLAKARERLRDELSSRGVME